MPVSGAVISWAGAVAGNCKRLLALTLFGLGVSRAAWGAEVTRVVSGPQSSRVPDINVSVSWLHEQTNGAIKREVESAVGLGVTNDLLYQQTRDVLQLRGDVGVWGPVSVDVLGSLVLGDQRSLNFDRRSTCNPTVPAADPCVNAGTSTALRDGFFAAHSTANYGLDAETGRAFSAPSDQVFNGPKRHGLEYLGFGVTWAVFQQELDDTKPAWLVRAETRLSLGQDMRFDPGKPTANTGVGLGYHQFILTTLFSRHFGRFEPYMYGWFMLPMLTGDSVFKQPSLQHDGFDGVQKRVGAQVGTEAVLWDDGHARRLLVEVRAGGEMRLAGLAQSEIWEMLAGDSRCATNTALCRAGIDTDINGDGKPDPNSGVTRSPAYGVFSAQAGLSATFGPHARVRGLCGVAMQPARTLTDGLSGNSLYDSPGRRFRMEDVRTWQVLIDAATSF